MGHRKWVKARSWREFHADDMIAEHNALYDAWAVERDRAGDLLKDRNTIQGKLDETRKRIAELESPTRVPFSDAQIERMAVGLRQSYCEHYGITADGVLPDYYKELVRAALAAGGLEPCAVPEYEPDDVALAPTGHVLRDRLVDAEAKIERQRKNLHQIYTANADLRDDITNAVRNAMDRLPDAPWKDKTATEAVWLLSLAVSGVESAVTDLRDQLAAADLDLADKAFYVREFAAVSAERDALKAELAAIIEATEQDGCDTALDAVKQLRAHTDTIKWREAYSDDAFKALHAELAALRERASVPVPEGLPTAEELALMPSDDEVEKLARVLCRWDAHDAPHEDSWTTTLLLDQNAYRHMARAAIAHLSTRPEGLPTADEIKYLPSKPHVFNNELLIAAYKALKTRHALEWDGDTNKDGWQRVVDVVRTATYETLRPWLRDPVGWELDVRAIDIANIIYTASVGAVSEKWKDTAAQRILDLCRSRIRPVFECKECEQWSKDWDSQSKAYEILSKSNSKACKQINTIRAALEGE